MTNQICICLLTKCNFNWGNDKVSQNKAKPNLGERDDYYVSNSSYKKNSLLYYLLLIIYYKS